MGDKYTVYQWIPISYGPLTRGMYFDWDLVWRGGDYKTAIKKAKMSKLRGAGCVKIEWR